MAITNNYKIICNYPKVVDNPLIIQTQTDTRWLGKRGDVKRDLYDNRGKVQTLISTISEWAKEPDKELLQQFYEKLVLQDISFSRQRIYFYKLKQLSKLTDKPISQFQSPDVHKIIFNLKQEQIPPATIKLYLETIKKFFKTALNKKPPVKDIKIHVPKHYPKQLLDEDDIIKLTNSAQNLRDKAYTQLQWETGGRVGEMMNCKIKDVDFINHAIYLDGKTGQRVIPVLSSLPFLKMYITSRAMTPEQYLWSDINGTPSKYDALRLQLKKIAKRAGINKPVNPHNFRHSRATHCAQFMTEPLLRKYFGWSEQSTVPSRYVHLSGKDLQNSILIMNGFAPQKPIISKLSPKQCTCQNLNTYDATKCTQCHKKLAQTLRIKSTITT